MTLPIKSSLGAPRLTLFLISCYFVGFHLRLSLQTGGGETLVPMWSMLAPAGLLLVVERRLVVPPLGNTLLALSIFLLAAHPLLAGAPDSYAAGLRSGMQLFVSVLAALIVIQAARRVDPISLRSLFITLWVGFILLALLEATLLSDFFRQVTEFIYITTDRGVYAAETRDVALYGKVRPSVFASEPSFLADSYMTATLFAFMLDPRRGSRSSWLRLVAMTSIGFAVAPSAKVAFYLVAVVVWQFWPRRRGTRVAVAVGGAGAAIMLGATFASFFTRVVSQVGVAETGSFYGRILVGPRVAWQALLDHPLMGYGVGNTEGLEPLIRGQWAESGAFAKYPWFKPLLPENLMSNAFWWQWSFFGLLGAFTFLMLMIHALRSIAIETPQRVIVCTWIVWYSGGAFVDPASWCVLTLFAIPALFGQPPSQSLQVLSGGQTSGGPG